MADFRNSHWAEKDFINRYLNAVDIMIAERKRLINTLVSFYKHFCKNKAQKRILDLGCGDGVLTHELLKVDSSISAILIDGSADMLDRAKARLDGFKNIQYINESFQDLLNRNIELPAFDLIVSSFAIHHLIMEQKKSLFEVAYSHLNGGGYFINIDVILSLTRNLEEWYLSLWREQIVELQNALKLKGNYEDIIAKYKDNKDNKPDTLVDQINALEDIGFRDVDCFYKYGIFVMYGGKK